MNQNVVMSTEHSWFRNRGTVLLFRFPFQYYALVLHLFFIIHLIASRLISLHVYLIHFTAILITSPQDIIRMMSPRLQPTNKSSLSYYRFKKINLMQCMDLFNNNQTTVQNINHK